jgi:hypothetical protein
MVRDEGVGIDAELLPHVFDLFIQADRSLERRQGGLGIGLTLVRRLVEMHGGRVEVASDGAGRGSEFTIRLPRLALDAPARAVDDQPDSTDSLALLLRLRGHEVSIAADGPGAVDEFLRSKPEVVFLDLGLPGMSGYDVARRLRAMPEGRGRPAGRGHRLRDRGRPRADARGRLRPPPGQAGGPARGRSAARLLSTTPATPRQRPRRLRKLLNQGPT